MSTHDTVGADLHKSNAGSANSLGLLDLFVVAAEIWPWLLLGPVLAGVIAYFAAAGQPSDYVAFSTFGTNAAVTETVLRSMLDNDVGEDASRDVTIDETAKLATITSTAATPDVARGAISDALKALMLRPGLSQSNAATVAVNLKQSQAQTQIYRDLFDELQPGIAAAISSEIGGQQNGKNDALTAFIALSDKLAALDNSNAEMQRLLDSKLIDSADQEIYVKDVQRSKLVPAVLSALLVGLAIYLGALLRHWWRLASGDPLSRPKIDRIRGSLKLRRSK